MFRRHVQYDVQDVLSHIGLQTNGKVEVLLVGFATKEGLRHEVCIEPEHGPLVANDLRSINSRTKELLEADPESGIFHTHPRVQENRRRQLFLRSRAHAIAEAIQCSGSFEGLSFFVSNSAPVGG